MFKARTAVLIFVGLIVTVACKKKYVEIVPTIKLTHLSSPTSENLNSVHFINSNIGYMAGNKGLIYKTSNQGQSWTAIDFPTNENINKIIFLNQDTGYVANNDGIYQTADGGANWSLAVVQSIWGLFPMDANITDVYFVNDQVGYAVDGGDYGKTFKTINGGQYWVELANTLNPLYAIHMLNEDSGFAVGNDLGFYNTTNGGASWSGTTASSIQNGMDVYYTEWNNGYVVGDHGYGGYGYFSHYDPNANVNDYTNEYSFDLFAIDFYGTRGVVVGEYSVLIPYEEGELGGIFWENMLAPDGTTIQFTYKDVVFADQSTFYAVGNDGVITRFQYPE